MGRNKVALAIGRSRKAKISAPRSGTMWALNNDHELELVHEDDVHAYLQELTAHIEDELIIAR